MYEYIGFGVPVISVFYDELEHFRPYINLYTKNIECIEIIEKMIDGRC